MNIKNAITNARNTTKKIGLGAITATYLLTGCNNQELKTTYNEPNMIRIGIDVPIVRDSQYGTAFKESDGKPGYDIIGRDFTNQFTRFVDTNAVNYNTNEYPYASNWKDIPIGDSAKQDLITLEKTLEDLQRHLYQDAKKAGY